MPTDRKTLTEQAIAQALAAEADTASPPSAVNQPFTPNFRKIGLPALLAGTGLDVASTYMAGQRGLQESNPLLGKDAKNAAILSALISGGGAVLFDQLSKKSPAMNKVANILGIGIGGLRGAVGVRNLGVK